MTNQEKSTGLLFILAKCLLLAEKHRRETQLGDRSSYLGVSDISRGSECLRAAVASKLNAFTMKENPEQDALSPQASPEEIRAVLQRQLTLSRGHWVEAGFGQALALMGLNMVHQLEIAASYRSSDGASVPIQGHLDFTLVWGSPRPAVRILEMKSYGKGLRDTLYTSYDSQIKIQVGLLHRLWNVKCFAVKDKSGMYLVKGATFPELCKQLFGITLPDNADQVDIEGWVVSIAPDDAGLFGPYQPDMTSLSWLLEIGATIWGDVGQIRSCALALNDVPYHEGFHPLCDWCDFNSDCPKYAGINMPEYEADLAELDRLKKAKAKATAELKEHENRMGLTYRRIVANSDQPVGWIRSGGWEFIETYQPGKTYVQKDQLSAVLLAELGGDEERVRKIVGKVCTTGRSYKKCSLRRINNPRPQPGDTAHA